MQVVGEYQVGGYKYQKAFIFCHKKNCSRCYPDGKTRSAHAPHGPYWYMQVRRNDGRIVRKYMGKNSPIGEGEERSNNGRK